MNKYNIEIQYLQRKLSSISYDSNTFKINLGDNRYLFGSTSPNNTKNIFSTLADYRTLYNTLYDLDFKLKISFNNSIIYAYSESLQENFSLFETNSEEEIFSYYYIENALFRLTSLWDLLAQFYRLYYNIDIPQYKIMYKSFFNPSKPTSTAFKYNAEKIHNYISQTDDTDIDGDWLGNHNYANKLRNKMTHRNSPTITVISNFDTNFKDNPRFMLKRLIEDYAVVSEFIREILIEIENSVDQFSN